MKYIAQVQYQGGGSEDMPLEARSKKDAELKAQAAAFMNNRKVKRIVVRETVPSVGGGK